MVQKSKSYLLLTPNQLRIYRHRLLKSKRLSNEGHLYLFAFHHFFLLLLLHQTVSNCILSRHQRTQIQTDETEGCQKTQSISMLVAIFHEVDEQRYHKSADSPKIQSESIA